MLADIIQGILQSHGEGPYAVVLDSEIPEDYVLVCMECDMMIVHVFYDDNGSPNVQINTKANEDDTGGVQP